jgi:hypothetical protein
VASASLTNVESLEDRVIQAYDDPETELEDLTLNEIELQSRSAFEAMHKRPWGEPWWRFRDV